MNLVPYTISRDSLTVFIRGVPSTIDDSHPNYAEIVDLLKSGDADPENISKLISIRQVIEAKVSPYGDVEVGYDSILYKGNVVHSYLADRMIELIDEGYDIGPWANFMNNLMQNPSYQAREELYGWLEKAAMPLTEDGCFLAYKKVRHDYKSIHDGKTDNSIGSTPWMPRSEVDDNRNRTCSKGLHFCSWHYLPHFGGSGGTRVVILKINPRDVVSIPTDYDDAKGRACQYEVIGEVPEADARTAFDGVRVYR
jgi:hypothetical protein